MHACVIRQSGMTVLNNVCHLCISVKTNHGASLTAPRGLQRYDHYQSNPLYRPSRIVKTAEKGLQNRTYSSLSIVRIPSGHPTAPILTRMSAQIRINLSILPPSLIGQLQKTEAQIKNDTRKRSHSYIELINYYPDFDMLEEVT